MAKGGGGLWKSPSPCSEQGRVQQFAEGCVWLGLESPGVETTLPLGNLLRCLTTLSKKLFHVFGKNFLHFIQSEPMTFCPLTGHQPEKSSPVFFVLPIKYSFALGTSRPSLIICRVNSVPAPSASPPDRCSITMVHPALAHPRLP